MIIKRFIIKNKKSIFIGSVFLLIVLTFTAILFSFPEKAQAVEKLYKVLDPKTTTGPGQTIRDVWKGVLNIVNVLMSAVLILIAFANILRININTYGIKKFLPTLVLAVIAANFSYLFCRIMIDLANVVMDLLIRGSGAGINLQGGESLSTVPQTAKELCDSTSSTSPEVGIAQTFCVDDNLKQSLASGGQLNWGAVGKMLLYSLLEFAGSIMILILAFLFFIRNYVVYFLVALSPLAFMSIILPQTKQAFSMWWTNFLKWTFLPVVSLFWLWVGAKWISSPLSLGGIGLMSMVFGGLCYYLAITTPFKIGGGIMSAWGNFAKKGSRGIYNQQGRLAAKTSHWGQQMAKNNPEGSWKRKFGKGLDQFGGVVNVKKNVEGLGKRRELATKRLQIAESKTGAYGFFGGPAVQLENMQAKHEATLTHMTPRQSVQTWVETEDKLYEAGENNNTNEEKLFREEIGILLGGKNGKWEDFNEIEQRDAIRRFTATENPENLLDRYGNLNGAFEDDEEVVLAQGSSRKMLQFLHSQKSSQDIESEYVTKFGHPLSVSAVPLQQKAVEATKSAVEKQQPEDGSTQPDSSQQTAPAEQLARQLTTERLVVPGGDITISAENVRMAAQQVSQDTSGTFAIDPAEYGELAKTFTQANEATKDEIDSRVDSEQVDTQYRHFGSVLSRIKKGHFDEAYDQNKTMPLSESQKIGNAIEQSKEPAMRELLDKKSKIAGALKELDGDVLDTRKTEAWELMEEIAPDSTTRFNDSLATGGKREVIEQIKDTLSDYQVSTNTLMEEGAYERYMGSYATNPNEWHESSVESAIQQRRSSVLREMATEKLSINAPQEITYSKVADSYKSDNPVFQQQLESHFDDLIATHSDLTRAIEAMPKEQQRTLTQGIRGELGKALSEGLKSSQSLLAPSGQNKIDPALSLADALRDPRVTKSLAKEYGIAMDRSLGKISNLSAQSKSSASPTTGKLNPEFAPPPDIPTQSDSKMNPESKPRVNNFGRGDK